MATIAHPYPGWDYRGGKWYDATGRYVGWSTYEDSPIHLVVPVETLSGGSYEFGGGPTYEFGGGSGGSGGGSTTPAPTQTVATPLNLPIWADVQLHGVGSVYPRDLAARGFNAGVSRDYSAFIESVKLSESAGESAMKMEVTLRDAKLAGSAHSVLTALTVGTDLHLYGYTLNPFLGGSRSTEKVRLFRGLVFQSNLNANASTSSRTYTAYDSATYLARNEAALVFHNPTYTQVFRQVCAKFGFTPGYVAETGVGLGKIIMGPGWTLWRLFQECGRRHYDKTGRSFYVRSRPNSSRSLDLLNFGDFQGEGTGITWHVGDGTRGTLTDYSYTDSAEELATRLIVMREEYDDNGNFKKFVKHRQGIVIGELRDTFGDLLKLLEPDSSLDPVKTGTPEWAKIDAQLGTQVKQGLANYGRTKKTATLTNVYIPGIRRGDRITAGVGSTRQVGWVVDSVATVWTATGVTQTIEIIQNPFDSSVGVTG